jgi:glycosyltransferase involved in cell wall biosynthesis
MATLRIAHVLTSLHIGGGERVALDLAGRQARAGHRVMVVSLEAPPEGPLAAEIPEGVELRRVAKRPEGLDPTLPVRLGRLFAKARIDAVHTHNPLPLIYGALPARLVRARLVHTKHGVNAASARSMQLRRAAARLVHHFAAVSEETAEEARRQRDCPLDRLGVVRNGIELDRFGPDEEARAAVRAELGIDAGAWVVGTVGRVVELKNQPLLVDALAPLLGEDLQLIIAGDGPAMDALRTHVDGIEGRRFVHLLGARRDVPRVLAALDCFALPSNSEGLPLVIPEAMACALPVVATSVGGVPKVVDETVGFLVPAGDERALRDRLDGLRRDPELAHRLGTDARRIALDHYSSERMAREYLALYEA